MTHPSTLAAAEIPTPRADAARTYVETFIEAKKLERELTIERQRVTELAEALREAGMTIASVIRVIPDMQRSRVVMSDGVEVSHQEMCRLTIKLVNAALSRTQP